METVKRQAFCLVLLLVSFKGGAIPSVPDVLTGEFAALDSSLPSQSASTETEVLESLREEARWTFSGMIYGFRFSYEPAGVPGNPQERLTLQPQGTIVPKDHRLQRMRKLLHEGLLRVEFRYDLDPFQQERLGFWRRSSFLVAGGEGSVPHLPQNSPRDALKAAIATALRDYMRRLVYNKPRRLKGVLAFSRIPKKGIREGHYHATVRLIFRVDDADFLQPFLGN